MTTDYQSHEDAVNPATTPQVPYTYADGAENTVRLTSLICPNGRELHYDYGSTGEMNDAASRVASLLDDDGTTHLAMHCDKPVLSLARFQTGAASSSKSAILYY